MKNIGLFVVLAAIAIVAFAGTKFYLNYKTMQQQEKLTQETNMRYVVNQIAIIKTMYHVPINVDSLAKQASREDDKEDAIKKLAFYRDSLINANR